MLRLLVKFVVLLLIAMSLSMMVTFFLFHKTAIDHYQKHPPEQALALSNFIREYVKDAPKETWEGKLKEVSFLSHFPWKVVDYQYVKLEPSESSMLNEHGMVFAFSSEGYSQYVDLGQGKLISMGRFTSPVHWVSFKLLLLSLTLIVIILATIGWFFLAPIVFSIRLMQKKTDAFRKGDWSVRLPDLGKDLIGELGRRFNEMAEKIEQLFLHQKYIMQAVSHELRTPMARIRFGLEMISEEACSETFHKRLAAIDEDLLELDHLVEELTLFQRSESLEKSLNMVRFSVLYVLQKLIERQKPLYRDIEFQLISQIDHGCSDDIEADLRYFERAMQNLIDNAANYGNSKVLITVQILSVLNNELHVLVEDDGKGVLSSHFDFIVQPFARIEQSRNRHFGGIGLGLTIVDRIVKAHKGLLEFSKSSLGGLCVHLTLFQKERV